MSWTHAAQLALALFAIGCFALTGAPRARNRFRRDVLPAPSEKCRRDYAM